MLQKAKLLDPRRLALPPIMDSVNIPVCQLLDRVFELPSKRETIFIADDGDQAIEARNILESAGYCTTLNNEYRFGQDDQKRLWSPNAFLESTIDQIPPRRALDIACGSGRDAVYLASRGFKVHAIDHLPDAIELGRKLAASYLEVDTNIEWIIGDVKSVLPCGPFDLITCFFFLDRTILLQLSELLATHGQIVIETFTSVNREVLGKPRSANYALEIGELENIFQSLEILEHDEDWHQDRHTCRFRARKLAQ